MAIKEVFDLKICVIGAGMGGLATALSLAKQGFRHVDVYETASNLGFVGAGIQLAPNMARILDRLGVWQDIEKDAVDVKDTSIREGSTDKELAYVNLQYVRDTYGYPHMVGHRSSLAGSLAEGCKREKGVNFFFSSAVGEVKSYGPRPTFTVVPRTGEEYQVECDILLAADGVKSTVRDQMLKVKGVDAKVIDSGQAAYRIMLKREELEHDPELLALIDAERAYRWIGEKRHIVAYPVSNGQIFNLSTAQPDVNFADAPSATYTTKGSKVEMMKVYDDFSPMIKRMLNLVPDGEVCEWKLRVHEPLSEWVHDSTALIGDASHATLPHMAQGAAQAIEDGAVLGVVLAKLPDTSPEAINKALRVYEKLRLPRANAIVQLAAANGKEMHLGAGAAKEERDRQFAALSKDNKAPSPDKWADAEIQKMVYGEDVMKTADAQFATIYGEF